MGAKPKAWDPQGQRQAGCWFPGLGVVGRGFRIGSRAPSFPFCSVTSICFSRRTPTMNSGYRSSVTVWSVAGWQSRLVNGFGKTWTEVPMSSAKGATQIEPLRCLFGTRLWGLVLLVPVKEPCLCWNLPHSTMWWLSSRLLLWRAGAETWRKPLPHDPLRRGWAVLVLPVAAQVKKFQLPFKVLLLVDPQTAESYRGSNFRPGETQNSGQARVQQSAQGATAPRSSRSLSGGLSSGYHLALAKPFEKQRIGELSKSTQTRHVYEANCRRLSCANNFGRSAGRCGASSLADNAFLLISCLEWPAKSPIPSLN